jgi:hypothetical protein
MILETKSFPRHKAGSANRLTVILAVAGQTIDPVDVGDRGVVQKWGKGSEKNKIALFV